MNNKKFLTVQDMVLIAVFVAIITANVPLLVPSMPAVTKTPNVC